MQSTQSHRPQHLMPFPSIKWAISRFASAMPASCCYRVMANVPSRLREAMLPIVYEGVFLISGIPGAGKTTVARRLAERLGNGVHIESDLLQEWIRSGGVFPNEAPASEAERQLRLRTRNVCLLADSYREAGFTPVIDDVVVGDPQHRLADFLSDLRSRPVRLVLLTPVLEVVRRRDTERGYKRVFSVWSHLDEELRRDTPRIGLWLDSSHLSVDETVEAILAEAERAVLP